MGLLENIKYLHHSAGGSVLDEWHNDFHQQLDNIIEQLRQPQSPAEIKRLRISASEVIGQVKVGADLINHTGEAHWLESVTALNKVLPEDQKIYIPPASNIPQV